MSQAIAAPAPRAEAERADLAAWLAVAAGTLGAFMALLDISIVNAALPVIQGEIGATPSEGTWVSTSYLVAEIIIMPLTAWLERLIGLRRVLLIGAAVFTVFSMVCGLATDLTTMIIGRVGQGLAGGTLMPTGMTIMAKRLPPSQQAIGMALFAAAALLGPILGPLVGGWITEYFSWRYAFFINLPICVGLLLLIMAGVPPEKVEAGALDKADWFGVAGMVIGLGSLTVLLEEGHREQWFDSPFIWQLAIASVIGFAFVAIGQFRAETPVLKLSLMRDRSYAAIMLIMVAIGVVMFAMLFVVPQFLAAVAGYNAFQSGQVLFVTGAVSIVGSLLYPVLVARVNLRLMVGCAVLTVASGAYLASRLTIDTDGGHFIIPLLMLGAGITYSAIPMQQAAVSAVSVADAGEATSMFNVGRNLGASIGLAALAGFLEQRQEFHHWRLHSAIGANDAAVGDRLAGMNVTASAGPEGIEGAIRMLDGVVMRQATAMAFSDIFVMLAVVSLVALPLVLLLKPIDPERSRGMSH